MRQIGTLVFLLLASGGIAFSQDQPQQAECPPGMACLTREAAVKALQAGDRAEALEKEVEVKDAAIEQLRAEIFRLQRELAVMSGEKTGHEQMVVRLTAIVDVLLKGQKKKCMPFSVCLF